MAAEGEDHMQRWGGIGSPSEQFILQALEEQMVVGTPFREAFLDRERLIADAILESAMHQIGTHIGEIFIAAVPELQTVACFA